MSNNTESSHTSIPNNSLLINDATLDTATPIVECDITDAIDYFDDFFQNVYFNPKPVGKEPQSTYEACHQDPPSLKDSDPASEASIEKEDANVEFYPTPKPPLFEARQQLEYLRSFLNPDVPRNYTTCVSEETQKLAVRQNYSYDSLCKHILSLAPPNLLRNYATQRSLVIEPPTLIAQDENYDRLSSIFDCDVTDIIAPIDHFLTLYFETINPNPEVGREPDSTYETHHPRSLTDSKPLGIGQESDSEGLFEHLEPFSASFILPNLPNSWSYDPEQIPIPAPLNIRKRCSGRS
ncbi:hypothetical protein Clacol_007899 [Clathrus columnatus]|uniref:Uncharacterized protein n=1 Tax=Clathrus columnatus TaxID=1419009 RepID=A0AAV5AKM6_9AGAM|nr:hypothetical protein Clacol_007899 [Clathrus columnatus]